MAFYRAAGGGDAVQHGEGVQVGGLDAGAGGDGALLETVTEQAQGDGLHEVQVWTRIGYDEGRHRQ
ncbi:hypothetical protein [Streptomyces sp. NPDC006335]|uniref:hypothetical protein n=1 Tax=Streptomyces sp. NPDC006335 TaxID=3156895 RepID=UPI0033B89791